MSDDFLTLRDKRRIQSTIRRNSPVPQEELESWFLPKREGVLRECREILRGNTGLTPKEICGALQLIVLLTPLDQRHELVPLLQTFQSSETIVVRSFICRIAVVLWRFIDDAELRTSLKEIVTSFAKLGINPAEEILVDEFIMQSSID